MKPTHPTDRQIQQSVFEKKYDENVAEHIRNCGLCKTKADQYALLSEGIGQMEKSSFDFDLNQVVMEKLAEGQTKSSSVKTIFHLVASMAVLSVFTISFLFGSNILKIFSGIKPISAGLIITTFVSLFMVISIDMIRKYKEQIKAFNFN